MNESLLNDVETDEVEDVDVDIEDDIVLDKLDDEAECNVWLIFKYTYSDTGKYVFKYRNIGEYLNGCSFVKKFRTPKYDWTEPNVYIRFYSENMSLDDLFRLILFMCFNLREAITIKNEFERINFFINIEKDCLSIDDNEFEAFIKSYFPDLDTKDIVKSFIRLCIRKRLIRRNDDFAIRGYHVNLGYKRYNIVDEDGNFLLKRDYVEIKKVEGCDLVRIFDCSNKYNFMDKNGNFVFSDYDRFDGYGFEMHDGYIKVAFSASWSSDSYWFNYVDETGKFLTKDHFKDCSNFNEGLAFVKTGNESYFIDTSGNMVFDKLFDECRQFNEGFASVKNGKKWNFIDKQGRYLSDDFFDECKDFVDGLAVVKKGSKKNLINKKGKILLDKWVGNIDKFEEGIAVVENRNKFNYIDKKGAFLLSKWFVNCCSFSNGYGAIKNDDGLWNFIDKNGKPISSKWYDNVFSFRNGYARIYDKMKDKWNYIDTSGKIISPDLWFDVVNAFYPFGVAEVKDSKTQLYNFIDITGELLSKEWFKFVGNFKEGFAQVKNTEGHWNYIDMKGNILYQGEWFNETLDFVNGFAKVKSCAGYNYLNTNGKLLLGGSWQEYGNMFDMEDGMFVSKEGYCVDFDGNLYLLI